MMPLGANTDQWIASIASYVRNSFGNRSPFITAEDVARVRAATTARKTMWTPEELESSVPRMLLAQPAWKVTASHNAAAAPGALTFTTWNSAAPQQPGMWFQVELPEAVRLAEIQFESPAPGGRGGGGGRGRGRGAAAAPGTLAPGQTPAPDAASAAAGRGAAPPAGAQSAAAAPVGSAPTAAQAGPAGPGAQPAPPEFTPPPAAYPRRYKVEVSMDGTTWSAPVAEGEGAGQSTVITFAPTPARFIRITQTATVENAPSWSIQRLRLFEVAQER
jgi:hypothetical protein